MLILRNINISTLRLVWWQPDEHCKLAKVLLRTEITDIPSLVHASQYSSLCWHSSLHICKISFSGEGIHLKCFCWVGLNLDQLLTPVLCTTMMEEVIHKQECEARLGEGRAVSFCINASLYWLSVSIELQLPLVYLMLHLRKITSLSETQKIFKNHNILWWKLFWEQNRHFK